MPARAGPSATLRCPPLGPGSVGAALEWPQLRCGAQRVLAATFLELLLQSELGAAGPPPAGTSMFMAEIATLRPTRALELRIA